MFIQGISCIFPVPDIQKTEKFYVTALGFTAVEYLQSKEPHVCLYKDDIEIILLEAHTARVIPNREQYGYGYDAYLYTESGPELETELAAKGIKIVKPLNITDYQNREIVIEDCDGRWLALGLKIKK